MKRAPTNRENEIAAVALNADVDDRPEIFKSIKGLNVHPWLERLLLGQSHVSKNEADWRYQRNESGQN